MTSLRQPASSEPPLAADKRALQRLSLDAAGGGVLLCLFAAASWFMGRRGIPTDHRLCILFLKGCRTVHSVASRPPPSPPRPQVSLFMTCVGLLLIWLS